MIGGQIFAKRTSYEQSSNRCSIIFIYMKLSVNLKMKSFLIIVVKLYRYKHSGVVNVRKIEYLAIIVDLFVRREM